MRKPRSIHVLTAIMLTATLLVIPASGESEGVFTDANARSWVLMEQETGTMLCGENIHEQLEPASVTKVMTMLLVVEALDNGQLSTDQIVTVSDYAASMGGSQIYLEPGEQITVNDLLKSVAVVSANDSAVALAECLCGSESAFVTRMNQRAAELGMEDTNFVNCNGLPAEGHVTSAWDIALMSRELMGHERITEYTTIWMDSVRGGEFGLSNTNKLIKTYSGITGLKTGYTDNAMYCLSATATREDMSLVAVVMGAPSSSERFSLAATLLDYGFANFRLVTPQLVIPPVSVELGEADSLQPVAAESLSLVVPSSKAELVTTTLELPETLDAPVTKGDPVGELILSVDGEEWKRIRLEAGSTVDRLTFPTVFQRLWQRMLLCEEL